MAPSKPSAPEKEKPVFFWREYGDEGHGYLSQWYRSPFHNPTDPSIIFQTAEQYMMYAKAVLFNDLPIASEILETTIPKQQKALGRAVKGFDQKVWNANRERIVEEGSYYKFKYGVDEGDLKDDGTGLTLRERLLATADREIVEASPMDKIWGIGFGAKNAENRRAHWGLNLLGKALMKVRDRLRAEAEEEKEAGGKEV
jgi:ribA/ribD-fused uncharacterized protein